MKCIISGYGVSLDTSIAYFGDRSVPFWTDGIESPSFIACGDGYLFALTENSYYAAIYAYRREGMSYRLTDRRNVVGRALCHLAYSPVNKLLIGSCYGSGHVLCAQFDPETGKFGDVDAIEQVGDNQSRAHCAALNRAEDRVYTANLGLDKLFIYRVENGKLVEDAVVSAPQGSGPRHLRLSVDEKLLYVITEYSNEILVYDVADWSLKQQVSTLPANHFGTSHCSTLCVSKDGRFVYAANRYADNIAVLEIGEGGLLTLKANFDCGGRSPRHMELTESGNHLVICCQDSDWVVIKHINTETGMPTHTTREIPFNAPGCVAFL